MDKNKQDDLTLIKETILGNHDSFAVLLSRYKNLVYSVILRMTNDREEANDLAQEVFIKVYKNLDKFKPEYKFSTWVIKIATNHVIDYRRKKKPEILNLDDCIELPAQQSTPETELIDKERSALINKAMQSLPDIYRLPIVLYHNEGLSYQDISEVLNEPLSKVKNRIFRARKILKESLSELREPVPTEKSDYY